jgi:hypothetical protein
VHDGKGLKRLLMELLEEYMGARNGFIKSIQAFLQGRAFRPPTLGEISSQKICIKCHKRKDELDGKKKKKKKKKKKSKVSGRSKSKRKLIDLDDDDDEDEEDEDEEDEEDEFEQWEDFAQPLSNNNNHNNEKNKQPEDIVCDLCRFEQDQIIAYEKQIFLFDETMCPKCSDHVQVVDNGAEAQALASAERKEELERLEGMSLGQLRKLLAKRKEDDDVDDDEEEEGDGKKKKKSKSKKPKKSKAAQKAAKKKQIMAEVELLAQDELIKEIIAFDNVVSKANSLFCQACKRHWHMRCLDKSMRHPSDEQAANWNCPICLGAEVIQEGHSAGRMRHNSIPHQIMLVLKPYHTRLFGDGEDKMELRNSFDAFKLVQEEFEGAKSVFRSVYDICNLYDKMATLKERVRLPLPGELIEEENMAKIIPRKLLESRKAAAQKVCDDEEQVRKISLSKYRFLSQGSDDKTCPICFDDMDKDIIILPCGHLCDFKCHDSWVKRTGQKPICCVCRQPAPASQCRRIKDNKIQVSERVKVLKDKSKSQAGPESELSLLEQEEPLLMRKMESPIIGSWGTKITTVIKDLKSCINSRTPARVIIFSQFPEMLPVLANACAQNHIQNVLFKPSAKGSQTMVAEFKRRAPKEENIILMLPIAKGAEGLTLIEGNIIMLLEPAFPVALEHQAVARIHRIGQSQQTFVYRYVVLGTVEQRLAEIAMEEKNEMNIETTANTALAPDVVKSLLEHPKPKFEVQKYQNIGLEDDGFDEDERWWLEKVFWRNQQLTRREVLDLQVMREDDNTCVLYGAEVTIKVADIVKNLKTVK